jgi:hypothetical protein
MLGRGRGNVQGCSSSPREPGKERRLWSLCRRVREALRNSAGTTGPSPAFHPSSSARPPNTGDGVVDEQAPPGPATTPESLTSHSGPTLISPRLSLSSSSPSIPQGRVHLLESCATRTPDSCSSPRSLTLFTSSRVLQPVHTIPNRVGDSPFLFEPLPLPPGREPDRYPRQHFHRNRVLPDGRKITSDRQLKETGIGGAVLETGLSLRPSRRSSTADALPSGGSFFSTTYIVLFANFSLTRQNHPSDPSHHCQNGVLPLPGARCGGGLRLRPGDLDS